MVAKGNRAVWLLTVLVICFAATHIAAAPSDETYLRFTISSRSEISRLTRTVSIDNVMGDTVYAYANPSQLAGLASAGYSYTVLPAPSSLAAPEMLQGGQVYAWDSYPTYDQYIAMMQQYAQNYPSLCRLDTIGTTTQGRLLLVATISANLSTEANKPEVLLTSSMHGDELTGYVLMLRLIDSLLTDYGVDQGVTHLLDSVKIYINPLANPDGTYRSGNSTVSGARRGNANGIDLNRNYPDPQDGPHPDGNAWQAETMAFMNFANTHWPVLSVNFHGGAQVVNYPWDTWVTRHADDAWFQMVCRQYADTCHVYSPSGYMADLDNGITDGFDWYEVNGGRQDYMNYFHGCREITIELSYTKLPSGPTLPNYWMYNRASIFQYVRQSLTGFRGTVTDAQSGLPVAAVVNVSAHDQDSSRVFADPAVGDYHRMIKGGTYVLEFTAPGYIPKTVSGVSVGDAAYTVLNVQLDPVRVCCVGNTGNVDGDSADVVDISDLSAMIDYLFHGSAISACPEENDVDKSGSVDIADLQVLIDYLFLSSPLPTCQ